MSRKTSKASRKKAKQLARKAARQVDAIRDELSAAKMALATSQGLCQQLAAEKQAGWNRDGSILISLRPDASHIARYDPDRMTLAVQISPEALLWSFRGTMERDFQSFERHAFYIGREIGDKAAKALSAWFQKKMGFATVSAPF